MPIYPTIRQLEIFIKVAQLRSFGRAAAALGLSQSALSQSITQMEYLLDTRLFERTTRTIRLTAAGEQFWPRAERLMADYDLALTDLKETSSLGGGRVTVGCTASVAFRFLPIVVSEFKARHPQIAFLVRDDNTHGVMQHLRRGEVDFAISTLVEEEGGLEFVPLLVDRFRLVCRRDDPLAASDRVAWQQLAGRDFVAMAHGTGTRVLLDHAMAAIVPPPRALYEVSHLATVLGMIEMGIGVSVLPSLAAPSDDHGSLCHRPLAAPSIERLIGIIQTDERALSPAATALRELIVDIVANGRMPDLPDVSVALGQRRPGRHSQRRTSDSSADS